MTLVYQQKHDFLGIIDGFVNSFSRLFAFISPLANKKGFETDVYLIMERLKEQIPQEKIMSFLDTKVVPKMPDLLWYSSDINIFINEIEPIFKQENIRAVLESDTTIHLPKNPSQKKRFLKDTIKIAYSAMLKEVSEQYELIRQGSIGEKNLVHLKISGEFMETLNLIRDLLLNELKNINKFNFRRFWESYSMSSLLLLRMYVIGKQIQRDNFKEALINTRFLGIERTRIRLEGG